MPAPVVFLDKDGTLVDDVPYNVDLARVRFAANAVAGLRLLRDAGYRLAVVTNQAGVARGYFPESALAPLFDYLSAELAKEGVPIAGFYHCPHHPGGRVPGYAVPCGCRKPAPGMILRAAADLGVDPRSCWMVGDILNDVEAGRRAGCRTVLIDNGNETEWAGGEFRTPHHRAADLVDAARLITAEGPA